MSYEQASALTQAKAHATLQYGIGTRQRQVPKRMQADTVMLKERTGFVLNELVGEYIATATPVPSKSLVRKRGLKVSPATVRNDMAELEEGGYIRRPHISAGAVPADRGYRYYVETLRDAPPMPEEVARQVRSAFAVAAPDPETWTRLAARVLAGVVGNVAIVTFPHTRSCRLKRIELVYLEGYTALLVVVFQQAPLRQRMVVLTESVSQDDLLRVANKLNYLFGGLQEHEIARKQPELTPLETRLKESTVSMFREAEAEAMEPCVDGLRHLLRQPEFSSGEHAGEAAAVVEERELLRGIIAGVDQEGELRVLIGQEIPQEPLRHFSLVLCPYGTADGPRGVIGILGPTRLEYQTALGSVRFLSGFMSDLLASVRG